MAGGRSTAAWASYYAAIVEMAMLGETNRGGALQPHHNGRGEQHSGEARAPCAGAAAATAAAAVAAAAQGIHCWHVVKTAHRTRLMRGRDVTCERKGSLLHQLFDANPTRCHRNSRPI